MRTRNDSPCDRDCPERSSHCHGSCEKYAAFVAKRTNKRAERRQNAAWTLAKTEAYNRGDKFRAVSDRGS